MNDSNEEKQDNIWKLNLEKKSDLVNGWTKKKDKENKAYPVINQQVLKILDEAKEYELTENQLAATTIKFKLYQGNGNFICMYLSCLFLENCCLIQNILTCSGDGFISFKRGADGAYGWKLNAFGYQHSNIDKISGIKWIITEWNGVNKYISQHGLIDLYSYKKYYASNKAQDFADFMYSKRWGDDVIWFKINVNIIDRENNYMIKDIELQ